MRDLQNRELRKSRIKEGSLSTNCIDNPYKFVYNCYHSFLITAKVFLLTYKVGSEVKIPFYYTYRHLEKDISEKARPLLRYAHFSFILTRLFCYWVCACKLYELFGIRKSFYISDFSQKEACKFRGNTFYRGNELNLFLLVFIHFLYKHFFKLFYSWFKEKEFFDVKDKGLREIRIVNPNRVFSKGYDFIGGKGGGFTFRDRGFNNFRDFIWFSFFKGFSRGIFKEYVKEGVGVNIKVFFSFWEKNCEGVFDLSFSFSKFMFKFLDETRSTTEFRVFRIGFKELRVIESKESKNFSIFFIIFRGVVSGDKFKESVDDFRVKDEGLDTFFNEKAVKGDVEPTRGFHNNNRFREGFEKVKEIREALKRHREFAGGEGFSFMVKDAEVEVIFRNVNTDIMGHDATSFLRFLSLTPSSRVAGALVAQPTYRVLRDRGTYSFGGSKAYKKWSPCPSLTYKLLFYYTKQNVLNKP